MSARDVVLIVGVDSLIGRHLERALPKAGKVVRGTTRRPDTLGENRIYLDLASDKIEIEIPTDVGVAIICAAASGYVESDRNPAGYAINVVNAARLVAWLLGKGIFTVFLSTNAVFSGNHERPSEGSVTDAVTLYGEQKAEAESRMLSLADEAGLAQLLAIVRLTKVVSWDTPTFMRWQEDWRAGRPIRPFTDLRFSPITLGYLADAILRLIAARRGGVYHLSGNADISYAEFAQLLARNCGLPVESSVLPTTSFQAGVSLANSPRFAVMSMQATTDKLGIQPQAVAAAADVMGRQWSGKTCLSD